MEFASALPVIDGVLSPVVDPGDGELMLGAPGATVSIVIETAADAAPVVSAASVTRAVSEWVASASKDDGVKIQLPEPFTAEVPRAVTPE